MKLARPKSILWFERLFVASIFLSAVRASLNWINTLSGTEFNTEGWNNFFIAMILTTAISFLIDIGLCYFVARRASNLAKWILVTKTFLGMAVVVWTLPSLLQVDLAVVVASTLFIQILFVISIIFLFRRDARSWFRDREFRREDTTDLAERFR